MWKNSTKRSYAFLYVLTLLCPGQITSILVTPEASSTATSQTSTAVTDGAASTSTESFSWLSWILGDSPLFQDVQEANLISSQLDQLIGDELQIEKQIEERSITVRRRRSPQDASTATSPSESVWYNNLWRWLGGNSQKSDGAADFQSDQLNQELTQALEGGNNGASQNPTAVNSKTNVKDPTTINGMTPIEIFKHYMPDGQMEDAVVSVNKWWNDPANTSYVRAIVITWKVVAFLTPGLGIIEQINLTVACTKLIWKTTKMYCEGSDMTDITVAVLPELAWIIFMYRRDEEYISEHTLKLGQVVDISSMNTVDFLKYIHSLRFPPLPEAQEAELRADVEAILHKYYKQAESMDEDQRKYMIDVIVNVSKFLSFFKPQGSIKVNESDAVQEKLFAQVYSKVMANNANS